MARSVPIHTLSLSRTELKHFDASKFKPDATAKAMLRWVSSTVGLDIDFPVDTPLVLKIADMLGYELNTDKLKYVFHRGYVPTPEKSGREHAWSREDVIRLLDYLENDRAWQPLHPSHKAKLNPDELARHTEEYHSRRAALAAFDSMTPLDLINLMVGCSKQETRKLLAATLHTKLTGGLSIRATQSDEAKLEAAANN